jgi:hypothetical protein
MAVSNTRTPARPAVLGRVHGHVGVAQQPLGVLVAGAGQADPDAGPGQHLPPGHGHRGAQDGRQPLAPGHRLVLVGDLGDQHGELVAAQPGRHVARLQAAAQPLGHHPQDLVAGGVAEAVVDGLEVVQVQQQQGRGGAGAGERGQGLGQAAGEQGPVAEPGEGVEGGQPGQLGGQLGPVQGQGHLGAEGGQGLAGLQGDQLLAGQGRRRQAQQLGGGGGGHPADGVGVLGGQQGRAGRGEHPLAGGPPPPRWELQAHDRSSSAEPTPQAGRSACEVLRQPERRL